ncbi:MAG: PhzF family phenazine biosynthesis protein [Planctomycetes bacterium]|nr:PhzF family phenazine biosynthesis protein [Planctomycetota bacterium]
MKLPIYQIDAFTSRRFSGNPAAVVVLSGWLPDATLQDIAAENNLAETAFVIPARGPDAPCKLRWFTPAVEVDLCGHATLATAHVLFNHYLKSRGELAFDTQSGRLTVARDGERLRMDFPARPPRPADVSAALVEALGARPREVLGARELLAVFETEAQVRALKPDMAKVAALETFAVAVTAPGSDVDFVSRFFAPKQGIDEDPVTGSSHCSLAPYWAARLGRTKLRARQLSARGGELQCEVLGERVLLSGAAVEYLRGEIEVDAA